MTNQLCRVSARSTPYFNIRAFTPFPNLVHGIFTRQGGVSRQPFDTLNLGSAVGDDPAAVTQNYQRACRTLDILPEQTVSCNLNHSANVIHVTKANRQRVVGWADGLITADPDIYLTMRFGDCTPLIFFDPVQQAVGLTHAGWRGTMKNAAGAAIKMMTQRLGCVAQNIIAVVGPAIGPCCYEVGPEVIEAAQAAFGPPNGLFQRRSPHTNRAYFDMWRANQRQLEAAGVATVIQSGLCTACRTDLFFSHRAEQGRTGRFGVMIGLRGNA